MTITSKLQAAGFKAVGNGGEWRVDFTHGDASVVVDLCDDTNKAIHWKFGSEPDIWYTVWLNGHPVIQGTVGSTRTLVDVVTDARQRTWAFYQAPHIITLLQNTQLVLGNMQRSTQAMIKLVEDVTPLPPFANKAKSRRHT